MKYIDKRDYEEALLSQGACNLTALIKSFERVISKIAKEAWDNGHGTDWINNHPICRLYAEQISHLSRGRDYTDAYEFCDKRRGR